MRFAPLLFCCVLLTGGCVTSHPDAMIGMPNPYTWHDSAEAAAQAAALPFAAPAVPEEWKVHSVASADINGALAQIRYIRPLPDGGGSDVMYRLSRRMEDKGDLEQRITRFSGDYNSYPDSGTLDVDGLTLYTRGLDGLICVAFWEDDYSRVITDDHGLTPEEVRKLVRSL